MQEGNKKFWSGLLSGLLLAVLIFTAGYLGKQLYTIHTMQQYEKQDSKSTELLDDYTTSKVDIIEDTIDTYFLEDVDRKVLENGIYAGMVDSLGDPYSDYYSSEELEEIEMSTQGIYYGIGAYVTQGASDEYCTISDTIADTPADAAGLRAGDIIYMVDGQDTAGMELTEVVALIKGEEGTKVRLTLVREGESDYLEVEVERREIETATVEYYMEEHNTGYISILEFDDVTVDQFTEAMVVLREQGMEKLIIDLRSNPGGNLTTVCDIARMLLPEGLIVYTEDKYGQRSEYTCDGANALDIPLVVLVNEYSASASEILAGAVKDYGIGTIMGTNTFGKGIVQRIITLSDGSALKLTVSKYYTPNGNDIHGVGIAPDVTVEFDSEAYYTEDYDNQLKEAVKYLNP